MRRCRPAGRGLCFVPCTPETRWKRSKETWTSCMHIGTGVRGKAQAVLRYLLNVILRYRCRLCAGGSVKPNTINPFSLNPIC